MNNYDFVSGSYAARCDWLMGEVKNPFPEGSNRHEDYEKELKKLTLEQKKAENHADY